VIFLVAACTVGQIEGPKYVPEAKTLFGPEPRIPNVFVGCWKGTVDSFDKVTSFSPSVSVSSIKALSTTYEFCFSKNPDGTAKLELTDVEIGGNKGRVLSFENRMTSIDSEFYRASMRNHATVESVVYFLWVIPIHMTQDVYAEEDLQMTSPDLVQIKGRQLVVIGGNMVAEMTFHAEFHRVGVSTSASASAG